VSYLIDTNGWIGFFEGRKSYGPSAKSLVMERQDTFFVSIASIWEASIKVGIGKLKLPYDLAADLPRIMDDNGFELLPVDFDDAVGVRALERVHGDPFDRIQVVQARRRGLQVISSDPVFERYGLKRVW